LYKTDLRDTKLESKAFFIRKQCWNLGGRKWQIWRKIDNVKLLNVDDYILEDNALYLVWLC